MRPNHRRFLLACDMRILNRFAQPCASMRRPCARPHPEVRALLWFGSWVKGSASVGNDVDLCIIVDRSDKARRDRIPDYLPRTFPVGIDLFIFTEEEFARLRREHPSLAKAIEEGVPL